MSNLTLEQQRQLLELEEKVLMAKHESAERLAKAVDRKAKNCDIRGAMAMLNSQADLIDVQTEMPFAQKVEEVKKKIIPENPNPLRVDLQQHKIRTEPLLPEMVRTVIRKLRRSAAPAIDRWNAQLFQQLLSYLGEEFIDMLIEVFNLILTQQFTPLVLDCLTYSRNVGIPKEDGSGVRPVSLSSFWLKILSAVITKQSKMRLKNTQYAFVSDGAARMAFTLKEEVEKGSAILKFDVKNAFSSLDRNFAFETIKQHEKEYGLSPNFMSLFLLQNIGESKSVMYDKGAKRYVKLKTCGGVQQGIAHNSILYSACMDRLLAIVCAAKWDVIRTLCQYIDDTVLATPPEHALEVASFVMQTFAAFGFTVNISKSKIYCETNITPKLDKIDELEIAEIAAIAPQSMEEELKEAITNEAERRQEQRNKEEAEAFNNLFRNNVPQKHSVPQQSTKEDQDCESTEKETNKNFSRETPFKTAITTNPTSAAVPGGDGGGSGNNESSAFFDPEHSSTFPSSTNQQQQQQQEQNFLREQKELEEENERIKRRVDELKSLFSQSVIKSRMSELAMKYYMIHQSRMNAAATSNVDASSSSSQTTTTTTTQDAASRLHPSSLECKGQAYEFFLRRLKRCRNPAEVIHFLHNVIVYDPAAPSSSGSSSSSSSSSATNEQQQQQQNRIQLQQSGSFMATGVNITSDYSGHNERQEKKNEKFFRVYDSLPSLHLPAVVRFTILRLCAAPRLIFYATTTPPDQAKQVVEKFQKQVEDRVTKLMDVIWTPETKPVMFQQRGCGIPDLISNSHLLFRTAVEKYKNNDYRRSSSLNGTLATLAASPSTLSRALARHLDHQVNASWLYSGYRGIGRNERLNDDEFAAALCIRCNVLPRRYSFLTVDKYGHQVNSPYNCTQPSCKFPTITNDQLHIKHLFECGAVKYFYHPTIRHNNLRDRIADVIRCYSTVSISVEPLIFADSYRNNKQRPDLLVTQPSPSVTDFCISCTPEIPGDLAAAHARKKHNEHYAATNQHGYRFLPFCAEIHGWVDKDALRFIRHIANQLDFTIRETFDFEMKHVTSMVLAHARIKMLLHEHLSRCSYVVNSHQKF